MFYLPSFLSVMHKYCNGIQQKLHEKLKSRLYSQIDIRNIVVRKIPEFNSLLNALIFMFSNDGDNTAKLNKNMISFKESLATRLYVITQIKSRQLIEHDSSLCEWCLTPVLYMFGVSVFSPEKCLLLKHYLHHLILKNLSWKWYIRNYF